MALCSSPLRLGVLLLCAALLSQARAARADILHLKHGGRIDGEVIAEDETNYQVRVIQGIVRVAKADVEKREDAPPPWVRYEEKRKATPETAKGQYELAQWCKDNRMSSKARLHLLAAIRIDPDFAPARRELGHVRRGGRWVEPPAKAKPNAKPRDPVELAAAEQDKLVRQAITSWFVRVRAIRSRCFDKRGRDETSTPFKDGRRQILAIKDPLALPALAGVLSGGMEPTRRLLVEALAQFQNDEATMNLLVVSLFDPNRDIRRAAAVELIGRKDNRLVQQLRDALQSEEEAVMRNAAVVLGVIRADDAVEDLIPLLETKHAAYVRVPRDIYLEDLYPVYATPLPVLISGHSHLYIPRYCAVLGPGTLVGTQWTTEYQLVSVYRTEVQEALIAITGKNFGFDANAWKQWWRAGRGR